MTNGRLPYWIYGSQLNSGAAAAPSRSDYRSIMERDWRAIAPGGENDWIAPHPRYPDVLLAGRVGRLDRRTLQDQDVDPVSHTPASIEAKRRHTGQNPGRLPEKEEDLRTKEPAGKPRWYFNFALMGWPPFLQDFVIEGE